MNVDSANPYDPPKVPSDPGSSSGDPGNSTAEPGSCSQSKPGANLTTLFIPPVLAIGFTLVVWLAFAGVLGNVAATLDDYGLLFVWSSTLFVSTTMSVYLVFRLWPYRLSAVSMSLGFILFGIVFCALEGDTSNGTDPVHMTILYGTLTTLPCLVFVMTHYLRKPEKS